MSDTPNDADRQLRANPAEYQRRSGPLGEQEGVTTEETRADKGYEVGQTSSKGRWKKRKRKKEGLERSLRSSCVKLVE